MCGGEEYNVYTPYRENLIFPFQKEKIWELLSEMFSSE